MHPEWGDGNIYLLAGCYKVSPLGHLLPMQHGVADTDTTVQLATSVLQLHDNLCNCQHLWLVDMKVDCLHSGHLCSQVTSLRGGAMVTCLCVLPHTGRTTTA